MCESELINSPNQPFQYQNSAQETGDQERVIKIDFEDFGKRSGKRKAMSVKEELKLYQPPDVFTAGVCVFAKMKGHREWPALITGTTDKKQCNVLFFGTAEIGIVPVSGLYLHCDATVELFSNSRAPKKRTKKMLQYESALREIEEYQNQID